MVECQSARMSKITIHFYASLSRVWRVGSVTSVTVVCFQSENNGNVVSCSRLSHHCERYDPTTSRPLVWCYVLKKICPVWAQEHCRISPPRFLPKCCKKRLHHGSFERLGSKGPPIGNGIWAIEWSRDRWRHVTPLCLERYISKTAGDRLRSKGPPIGNDIWSIKWSCAASQEGRLS